MKCGYFSILLICPLRISLWVFAVDSHISLVIVSLKMAAEYIAAFKWRLSLNHITHCIQVFITLINYVGIQKGFENTSKNGIMCLLGLQFSVSQLNFHWLPGTICSRLQDEEQNPFIKHITAPNGAEFTRDVAFSRGKFIRNYYIIIKKKRMKEECVGIKRTEDQKYVFLVVRMCRLVRIMLWNMACYIDM